MAKVLYWTGAGIGNLIQATPAFYEIVKHGHELVVYPEDVPRETLECIYPYSCNEIARFTPERPGSLQIKLYDFVIYSEFRGLKNPPEGKNVFKPKMNWWNESESYYHVRSSCSILSMSIPEPYYFYVRPEENLVKPIKKSIMLCPAGKGAQRIKRWPYYPILATRLKKMGWNVFVTGDPEELRHPKNWGGCEICVGMPLMNVGQLMQKMEVVVANDSGLMHYANALGVDTYAIVGPTSATKNIPKTVKQISRKLCNFQPCQEKYVDWVNSDQTKNPSVRCKRECLTSLSVDHVLESVIKLKYSF